MGYNQLPGCSGSVQFLVHEKYADGSDASCPSHIHVSMKGADGKNIFAVSDDELKTGRKGAANEETKFISQQGEWFLAGVLDGLPDSKLPTYLSPQFC